MATTGAELALDTGRGGDMRFLLLAQEAVRAAMRKQSLILTNAVLYMNAPHTRKLRDVYRVCSSSHTRWLWRFDVIDWIHCHAKHRG